MSLPYPPRPPLKVFITVDTEVWRLDKHWAERRLVEEIRCYVYGQTASGLFGLPYQIAVLNAHGLKAVYFVEPLFAKAAGIGPLREMVELIQRGGQEVQLHIHTEWLNWMRESVLPGRNGINIRDFSEEEQLFLLQSALELLRAAGAPKICAFRAGNFGANSYTLMALKQLGITYDTSYNPAYLGATCGLSLEELLYQPTLIEGVYELPVSCFRDWPGHLRQAHLCACSIGEMEHALLAAWRQGWYSFVIVVHNFELIKTPQTAREMPVQSRIAIQRFKKLCRFLCENSDKFQTSGFNELRATEIPLHRSSAIHGHIGQTISRIVQQVVERVI